MRFLRTILTGAFLAGCFIPALKAAAPAPVAEPTMTADQVETYVGALKRGAPIELALDKGKKVRGLFSSYDDYYETVWIVPQGERGAFNQKGFKLSGIRNIVPWERKSQPAAKSTTTFTPTALPSLDEDLGKEEYYLLKQN